MIFPRRVEVRLSRNRIATTKNFDRCVSKLLSSCEAAKTCNKTNNITARLDPGEPLYLKAFARDARTVLRGHSQLSLRSRPTGLGEKVVITIHTRVRTQSAKINFVKGSMEPLRGLDLLAGGTTFLAAGTMGAGFGETAVVVISVLPRSCRVYCTLSMSRWG